MGLRAQHSLRVGPANIATCDRLAGYPSWPHQAMTAVHAGDENCGGLRLLEHLLNRCTTLAIAAYRTGWRARQLAINASAKVSPPSTTSRSEPGPHQVPSPAAPIIDLMLKQACIRCRSGTVRRSVAPHSVETCRDTGHRRHVRGRCSWLGCGNERLGCSGMCAP
jgi:hypothetical protein